jgi:poly-gamma-glutamate system protein
MAVLSIITVALAELMPTRRHNALYETMLQAAGLMRKASSVVRHERLLRGLKIDKESDPNDTGLIGSEYTELTSTLGPIEIKRTTTNPDFAAAVVRMLAEAGVRKGDVIAIGTSGSFPALTLATLCASQAMGVDYECISSIGASTYGATDPELSWLDMESALLREGIISHRSIAASPGGDEDRMAKAYFPQAETTAYEIIARNGVRLVTGDNLAQSIAVRMELYQRFAEPRKIAAFVNIGGAEANLGQGDAGYYLPAGVVRSFPRIPDAAKGVVFAMAGQGVPVINLLNVRQLVLTYGLSMDPIPLPKPGEARVYFVNGSPLLPACFLGALLLALAFVLWLEARRVGEA